MVNRCKASTLWLGVLALLMFAAPSIAHAQEKVATFVFPDGQVVAKISEGVTARVENDARLTHMKVMKVSVPRIARELAAATLRNVGQNMQLIVGCETIFDAVVREPILGGSLQISGTDTDLDAKAALINAGAPLCEKK